MTPFTFTNAPAAELGVTNEHGVHPPPRHRAVEWRVVVVSLLAVAIAVGAAFAAQALTRLIAFVTNLSFYGRLSIVPVEPTTAHWGWWTVFVPIGGALIVGLMARYGSVAIRGHGIPEVMERVLFGESRIPARLMVLKPVSAAIAMGTGGPFGAEGPIIATGGALGSVAGQLMRVTADERKVLLAAGAAAGMAATFGSPVAAVLLAVELLLFEYRPRSLIPVALASATAAGVRIVFEGTAPAFAIATLVNPPPASFAGYVVLGALIGVVAAAISRVSYAVEEAFHRLPIHWMWWPALGAVAVGVIGLIEPRTMGVGYGNITAAIGGSLAGSALLFFVLLKFLSWVVYLGSGTSGGTLAPLFTVGSGLAAWIGALVAAHVPAIGMDPHMAGLVGMAAIFAGASHALLASVIFAFETTRQPVSLLPLLAGGTAAYLLSRLISPYSIMTEKLARRGSRIQSEYAVDHLAHVLVRDVAHRPVATVRADDSLATVRAWLAERSTIASHQGFPVLDADGALVGVVTRRDLLDLSVADTQCVADVIRRRPAVVYEDSTLREAADHMVMEQVGRLPVVQRDRPRQVTGIISRSDILAAHGGRLQAAHQRDDGRLLF